MTHAALTPIRNHRTGRVEVAGKALDDLEFQEAAELAMAVGADEFKWRGTWKVIAEVTGDQG